MRHVLVAGFHLAMAALACSVAHAKPPISAFTPIADVHDMALSPDGKRIAWVQRSSEGDGVVERNLETGKVTPLALADGREIMDLSYLTDTHLHFVAYRPEYNARNKDAYRVGTAHIYDLARAQTYRFDAYGRILRVNDEGTRVFMLSRGRVLEIVLANGNLWSDELGRNWEDDYVLDGAGKLVATQDINRETGINEIFAASGSDRRQIFREGPKPAEVHLLGLMPDGASVVVEDRRDGARSMRTLNVASGELSEPLFGLSGTEVLTPFRDRKGNVLGAAITGLYPRHEFFDAELTADARSLRASFPGQAVRVVNWSDDRSKILVHVEGGIEPGRYALFDRTARKIVALAQTRPAIARADMGESVTIEYPARDGQKISAIVTWPTGIAADQRKNLPMVVMPNQSLDYLDGVGFDWVPQYLANQGYVVFQPNYRGSGGLGAAFRNAGIDQFGRAMQHDVTDGVHALGQMGWIDTTRVCAVGFGWGGYVALMAGALTPDRYRCVAAVGSVTDLPDFLKKRMEGDQRYNDYTARWKRMLGDPEDNRINLLRYSPVNLARQYAAPVLLIHSEFDIFSPNRQSRKMEQALEAASKPVRRIPLERENEYLIRPETRELVLKELGAFIAANMTPRPAPPATVSSEN